jgi:hypothetical protein
MQTVKCEHCNLNSVVVNCMLYVHVLQCASSNYFTLWMQYNGVCARYWNRVQYRFMHYAMMCHMIRNNSVHAASICIRLRHVLICVRSIALTCVYAIQARILAGHVNVPHHAWLLIRMNEHNYCCNLETWLILPVVICLYQRLSHACVCIYFYIVKPRIAH